MLKKEITGVYERKKGKKAEKTLEEKRKMWREIYNWKEEKKKEGNGGENVRYL